MAPYVTEIKIRGYHLDGNGHVNNARWVELLEEARWRWLDDNLDLTAWEAIDQGIAVASLEVNYRRPARLHDRLEFRCVVERCGGRAAVCRQEVVRRETGEKLLDARLTLLLINRATGRLLPLADDLREMMARYLAPTSHPGRPSR